MKHPYLCQCNTCFRVPNWSLQSEEHTDTEDTTKQIVQAENIQFRDGSLSTRITMGDFSAGDFNADNDNTASLGSFLSRPVRIINFTWQESTFLQSEYYPWQLYFNTAQIKKKLDNYARLRCKLKLKFVLNASPFYYGSLRACYFPIPDQRSSYLNSADQLPFSQTPGLYLEPQNMSTAEMTLPFLWSRNWLNATDNQQFNRIGKLAFLQYANLRSANGVVGSGVNISVYAWAEEVEVAAPTTGLALQSSEKDEYSDTKGTISGPASAIANVASKLENVPGIGPFAMATNIGASAVSGIAKIFGYSNPPMIDDVHGYQPKSFHAFANTETRMPIDKLSVDPKNEVTISPQVAGIMEDDPLAFDNLLSKESFILGTLWSGSSAVDSLLWSAQVGPVYATNVGTSYTSIPMSYFGQMFRYWRGSIIYKFRFIKTKYHKGRVIISWDPTTGNVTSPDVETTTLTKIVDLEVDDEVEFEVPYKAITPYLETSFSTTAMSNGATPLYPENLTTMNGNIVIRVQNVLTGPVLNPQIDILGYVRPGKDFVFAVPKSITNAYSASDPLGVIQSSEVSEETAIDLRKHYVDSGIAAITTGESLASLRPILHRTSLSEVTTVGAYGSNANSAINIAHNYLWRVPRGLGRDPNGYHQAVVSAVNVPYTFSPNHPIDWTLNCFVGFRGSTNIHVNPNNFDPSATTGLGSIPTLSAERSFINPIVASAAGNRNANTIGIVLNAVTGGISRFTCTTFTSGHPRISLGQSGMSLTNTNTQSALSVNVPQYSNSRFTLAFKNVRENDPATIDPVFDVVDLQTIYYMNGVSAGAYATPTVSIYYSAGVDFQPIFFLCTPRLFDVTTLPNVGTAA